MTARVVISLPSRVAPYQIYTKILGVLPNDVVRVDVLLRVLVQDVGVHAVGGEVERVCVRLQWPAVETAAKIRYKDNSTILRLYSSPFASLSSGQVSSIPASRCF